MRLITCLECRRAADARKADYRGAADAANITEFGHLRIETLTGRSHACSAHGRQALRTRPNFPL